MAGRRHSQQDIDTGKAAKEKARGIVADLETLGFIDDAPPAEFDADTAGMGEKSLVTFGAAVKALGDGRVGGYLVRFSSPDDPDLTGDFFTADTDFGDADTAPVLYQHGLDDTLKRRKLGKGTLKKDAVGVWIEAQLAMRDDYEKAVYQMAEAGALGWSSGTASHLVEREQSGKSYKVVSWPLGLDASLTPTPAEPRNDAMTLKAYVDALKTAPAATPAPAQADTPAQAEKVTEQQPITEKTTMSENTQAPAADTAVLDAIKKLTDEITALKQAAPVEKTPGVAGIVAEGKAPAVIAPALPMADDQLYEMKRFLNTSPAVKEGREQWMRYNEDLRKRGVDAEHAKAFSAWVREPRNPYKAQAMADAQMKATLLEGTASLGGNLVPTLYSNQMIGSLKEDSILRRAGAYSFPISGTNSLKVTSITRSTSAALVAENAAPTASEPTFGVVSFDAYAYKATYVATREVLTDSRFPLESVLLDNFNWQFIQSENAQFATGTGSSQPQGIAVGATMSVSGGSTLAIATANGDNVLSLYHALPYQYRANGVWFANDAVLKAIRQTKWASTTGAGSTTTYNEYLWPITNDEVAPFGRLLGRPIFPLNTMVSSGSTGAVLVFADPRFFWIGDFSTGGTEIQVLNELYAASFAVGWNAWRRFDSNLMVSEAAVSMKLL